MKPTKKINHPGKPPGARNESKKRILGIIAALPVDDDGYARANRAFIAEQAGLVPLYVSHLLRDMRNEKMIVTLTEARGLAFRIL
jgi:hypothetical protein